MRKKIVMERKTEKEIISIGKDILVSLIIIGIILGSLYAFSGRWPPMVVIESSSMAHDSHDSEIGVIDAGDIVVVQEVDRDEITTYVEGRAAGYSKYGLYGDVIVFRPDGNRDRTPVIHRPVCYMEYHEDSGLVDIPSLVDLDYGEDWDIRNGDPNPEEVRDGKGLYGTLRIYDYQQENETVAIDLDDVDSSGFITKGDNNDQVDQDGRHRGMEDPIKEGWVLGKARGELPWFGILKLVYLGRTEYIPANSWTNLIISITAILLIPLVIELITRLYWPEKMEEEEGEKEEDLENDRESDGDHPGIENEIG